MVKRTEIKERMIEMAAFKYCEQNGISTDIAPTETFTELSVIPMGYLEDYYKRWNKNKVDTSKVNIAIKNAGDCDSSKITLL